MNGVVFLDRDGTLIEDAGYLGDPAGVRILPGAAEGLRRLAAKGYALAVVSNQAGLARGKFTRKEMEAVHRAFVTAFRKEGVRFDAVEYCPHHPDGAVAEYRKACGCRKPATGLADAALRRLAIPDACPRWVVGDKMTDILLGLRLGARTILVATGYGAQERAEGQRMGVSPEAYLPGMLEAARWIVSAGSRA